MISSKWCITPTDALAKQIRKSAHAFDLVINISNWQKKFYREILHGKALILSETQQRFIIKKIFPEFDTQQIITFTRTWSQHQTECITLANSDHIKYNLYLEQHNLTDTYLLSTNIINELNPIEIHLCFYGFNDLKPNIKHLFDALSKKVKCEFFNPEQKNISKYLIQHSSEYHELEWLRQFIKNTKEKTLIVCRDSDKIKSIIDSCGSSGVTNVPLISTILVNDALVVLNEFHNFENGVVTLDFIKLKYSNSLTVSSFQNDKILLTELKILCRKFAEDFIWQWHQNLMEQFKKLPKMALFQDWSNEIQQIIFSSGWPFKKIEQDQKSLINFWYTNLLSWSQQDIYNEHKISLFDAIKDLENNVRLTSFRTDNKQNDLVITHSINEISGMLSDNLIVLGADNKLVPEEAEKYHKIWQSQAKSLIYSQTKFVDQEPMQPFPPAIKWNLDIYESKVVGLFNITYKKRKFLEMINTLSPTEISSKMIADQAKCPLKNSFKNLSFQKIGKKSLPSNELNLVRGICAHDILAKFWMEIKELSNLKALSELSIEQKLEHIIQSVLKTHLKKYVSINYELIYAVEQEYLKRIILRFIDLELARESFKVKFIEHSRSINISGYKIEVRIDRVDEELDGLHLLDYKTGNVSISNWLGDPPEDTQIPLYLCDQSLKYKSASYACLNKNFTGIKGFKNKDDWQNFTKVSKEKISNLISDITSGSSYAKPINKTTCQSCEFIGICRPEQKINTVQK